MFLLLQNAQIYIFGVFLTRKITRNTILKLRKFTINALPETRKIAETTPEHTTLYFSDPILH